ncbi:carboxylesterase family protein [Sphingomonas sp. RB56-2]|uniref:Carboxylic ester hydrolase n=1 Tax=Sphingomonas brevis TaxID=2908206 RepID=A0ABT0S5Y7_9SPHN|nr:carboxylesterase family protein [Sphingomonas brevis]MCL6739803.1 carboxylesterase family protein [Sphingomonas brevis]
MSAPANLDPAPHHVRRTAAGWVQGFCRDGICRLLGIPYAAPPSGENRFREPQPVEPWEGVRDATRPGPSSYQKLRAFPEIDIVPLIGDGLERGEDFLALNIWAPQDASDRPVMVWIHGGGFVVGSKDAPISDGTSFARSGVVCVAINYRLGIDGFLPIPGIPTNLGLRDMLAALKWVQDNIAQFGGDPANVTVFGESAGAMAIANLVASPLAEGLFRRAIVGSGHGRMVRNIQIAQRLVRKLARILKIEPTADGFRTISPERGWAAMEKVSKPFPGIDLRDEEGHEPVFGISRFVPVYGDDVLPEKPVDLLNKGVGKDIDLLIGTNSEEMNLYFVPTKVRTRIPSFLAKWLVGKSHPDARTALKSYGLGEKKAGHAMTDAMTDMVFRWPARSFAEAHRGRTHFYEFDWRSPACGGELGACHGMELPFVFKTLDVAKGPHGIAGEDPPEALADRIHQLWVDFATDGSLPWPEFDARNRNVHLLGSDETIHEPVMPAAALIP